MVVCMRVLEGVDGTAMLMGGYWRVDGTAMLMGGDSMLEVGLQSRFQC